MKKASKPRGSAAKRSASRRWSQRVTRESAMSMLTFYVNRAGRTLPASRRRTLMKAKDELRALYGR